MVKIEVILFFVLSGITSNKAFISSHLKNVWSHINDKLYELVDEVFITLKINVNFTKSEKVADSFLLNNFVQNVSARNYKKYEEMYNLSKMTIDDNKTAYFIFIINEMMEEFIMLERKKLKPHISVKYYKNNLNNNSNNSNNSNGILFSEKNITFNMVKLNNEFNSKVEKSLIKDIVYKLLFANSKKSLRRSGDQDLKQWVLNASSLQTRRVYNGQAVSVVDFPFMASIHIERRFACAGAIIRKDFIITAASCLKPFHAAQRIPHLNLEVRVASDFTSQYGELIPVTEMYFHPHFNHESLSNNLAILKLRKRLKFNQKARKIMVDDKANKMPENAENIFILGWGSLNMKKEYQVETTPLSYAFVDVYNLQECKNVYSSFYVKDKNFCTGYVSEGSGACKNDIGGPAVVDSVLTGVISYGSPHCGQPDAPTVYTKLGYYADWINSVCDGNPEENNDIEPKSRYVSRPRDFMTSLESADYPSNVTSEIDTLAQLIGELDVVKHINSTLTEILKEKQTEDTNIKTITDKDGPTSKEADNDVINLDNVLQYFNQDSTSTTPESIAIPVDASEYENGQNYENIPIVNTKESEEETNNKNTYIDSKQFMSDDTKSSPPKSGKLTTDAGVDDFTIVDEWPRTRFDREILKEMIVTNVTDFESDTYNNNNNNNTQSGSFELIPLAPMSNEIQQSTSNVPISSKKEKKQILEIVFLTSTRPTRFSVKDSSSLREPPLPRNLPLIYYESSNRHKSFKESYF
ncbi:uncharacterized protein [Choristoneura fumiferana]|uniref:uncharacterized protein n=1 Tax=Choristoneura fumiferana TaxID=7141 RepID=UPI003D1546F3